MPGDSARLHSLVDSEILIEADAPASMRQPPLVETPTHDLIECRQGRMSLAIFTMFVAEMRAARVLRKRPFHEVLAAAARERRPRRHAPFLAPAWSIETSASAAAALSFITGSHDRCLVRALAAHRMCKHSGSKANLVFGVIAHPFTAHCWVQVGSAVVVGGYEHTRLYTPILVV